MPNQLAEEVKKAELTPPSDADLRAELQRERDARMKAEQDAAFNRGAASAEWQRAENATRNANRTPVDPLTDPIAKLAAEDPLLDPEKRARLMDEGIRGRGREEAARLLREYDARRRMEDEQKRTYDMIEMFRSNHPELSADSEGFAAAMTRADIRSSEKGMNLSPLGKLQLGYQIYNEGKANGSNTPFTEAPGNAGPGGVVKKKEEPEPISAAEQVYGARDFVPDFGDKSVPLDKYTEAYLDDRNLALVEKEKFWSAIRNVDGDIRMAKTRKAAAGR